MEFLRFGSRIPGAYQWGCCAVCIIQDFKQDPDDKASIEIVSGDSGTPFMDYNGNTQFLGTTYRDIFHQRLRIGTFSNEDMPNHVFLAVLTAEQINYTDCGQKWLAILKEAGFEFIRTTDNSVYTGTALYGQEPYDEDDEDYEDWHEDSHLNYVFGLFRNIGSTRVKDPFTPPAAWTALGGGVTEVASKLSAEMIAELEEDRYQKHLSHWDKIGRIKTMTEAQLIEAGVPVILAGKFSENPQEPKEVRKQREESKAKGATGAKAAPPAWKTVGL